jgi:hypothetical protein
LTLKKRKAHIHIPMICRNINTSSNSKAQPYRFQAENHTITMQQSRGGRCHIEAPMQIKNTDTND